MLEKRHQEAKYLPRQFREPLYFPAVFRASATHETVACLVPAVQPASHAASHDPPKSKDAPQPCEWGGLGDGPQLTFWQFSKLPLYWPSAPHMNTL